MSSIEVKSNVPVITRETTQFPPGGATVQIERGVPVKRGLDFGDVAGRGIRVEPNGQPIHPCAPKDYTGPVDKHGWPQGKITPRIPY